MKPIDSPASAPSITRTDAEWRQQLTSEQGRVLRQAGTERPFGPGYEEFKTPTDQGFCINGVSLQFVPAGATSAVPAKAGPP